MKKIAMLLAAGCAIGMLTGCGIPEDEHNAIVDGLKASNKAEVDKLNGTISDRDDVIRSEKAKAEQKRIELATAEKKNKTLEQKNAETSKLLTSEKSKASRLDSELKTSKSQTASARDDAMEAENKFNTLEDDHQKLQERFDMFQQNMLALNAPEPEEEEPIPEISMTDAEKINYLLSEMGTL